MRGYRTHINIFIQCIMNESGYADLLNSSTINADALIIGTLVLPNLDANSVPVIDADNGLTDIRLNDGQVLIGRTGNGPVAATLTGTDDEIYVTNGSGSISLSLPQPIAPSSSPTFNDVTLSSINTVPVDDYIITPSIKDLNMNSHNLSNVSSLNGILISNYLKTPSTVDLDMNNHWISKFNSLRPIDTNVNIGNSTSLPLGGIANIVLGDFTTATGSNSVCIGAQNISRNNSVAIGKETVAGTSATVVGYRSSSGNNTDSVIVGHDNVSSGVSADIIGINRTNNQANSLLLGNGSYINIRANSSCDLGTSSIPFQNIYSSGSINGTVNGRLTNDIVSNTSSGTLNNLVSFVSSKVIKDSTIPATQITTNTTNIATNASNITTNTNNISVNSGNISALQGKTQNQIATVNNTNFSGTLQQGGVNVATVASLNNYVARAGDSMSGALAMQTNDIQNVGNLSGSSITRSANNILSCLTAPAYGNLPMFSTTAKQLEDSAISSFNVVSGPASAVNNNLCSFNLTTGKVIKDSGINSTNVVTNTGSSTNNSIAVFSGTTGKIIANSGTAISQLVPYSGASTTLAMGANGVTGSGANTAGSLALSGVTDSTSSITGTFTCAGGMSAAKRLSVGTNATIGVSRTTPLSALEIAASGINITDGAAISSLKQCSIMYNTSLNQTEFTSINQGVAFTPAIFYCNNVGLNSNSSGNAANALILGFGTAPTANPTNAFVMWTNSTGLWARGPNGTVTKLANP